MIEQIRLRNSTDAFVLPLQCTDKATLAAEFDTLSPESRRRRCTFTLAQLPFIAAVLGVGHLIRSRAPRLSAVGATLAVVGAFGHSVCSGFSVVLLSMAADSANRDVYAALIQSVESGPAVAFMAMGLAGTVLGDLALSIGLWRARVTSRWLASALWAFQVSAALFLAALGALALTVWRSPRSDWEPGAERFTPASPAQVPAG